MIKKLLTLFSLLYAFFTYAQSISLTTTSNSASWSPSEVRNYYGSTLRWQASNSQIGTLIQDVNDPTFDFSGNDGTPINIIITSADGLSGLTRLYVDNLEINYFNVSEALNLSEFSFSRNSYSSIPDFGLNTNLTRLYGYVNQYGSIDISKNPKLEVIYLFGLPITDLNIDDNPKLKYVSLWNNEFTEDVFDYIVNKLDEFGVNDGYLYIRDRRNTISKLTQASSASFKNLKNKGWLIDIPQINITGLGNSIPGDGSNVPAIADDTNFGSVAINSTVVKKTFTIENAAIHNSLLLTDPSPYILISGDSDFSLSILPSSSIPGATDVQPSFPGTSTFEITFNPQTAGEKNAIVSIKSNDPYKTTYTFNIEAIALPNPPEIEITGLGVTISSDGSNTPSKDNDTDFGTAEIAKPVTKTFTIQNQGAADLQLTGIPLVTITGENSANFNITSIPESLVLAQQSTTFEITFLANEVGSKNALVTIKNNDFDEGNYMFNIQATIEDKTYVPDDIFEGFLICQGYDDVMDDFVLTKNIINVEELSFPVDGGGDPCNGFMGPVDLTGIEDFKSLKILSTSPTRTEVFDLSMLPNLEKFSYIPYSSAIRNESINLSKNLKLKELYIGSYLSQTVIKNIDLTSNVALESLVFTFTNFSELDLSNNTELRNILIDIDNELSFLDLSNNKKLISVNIQIEKGIGINLKNENNTSITTFHYYSGLFSCIQVDDATWSEINWIHYDNSYIYSENCNFNGVPIGPKMLITGNEINISHGTTTVNIADGTDFGEVIINGNATQTFFMKNIGDEPLSVYPNTTLGIPFTVAIQPSSPISPGDSTAVKITYSPTMVGTQNAQVIFYSNDLTNPLFPGSPTGLYSFYISGKCVNPPPVQDIMITQYYEGSTNSNWIEVVNRSGATISAGDYYLALYDQGEIPLIQTQAPSRFVAIPQLTSGQVVLFSNFGATFPVPGNIGLPMLDVIESTACDFDGNDIILISSSVDANCYTNRVDMMGNLSGNQWGVDTSFIRGGFSSELPEGDFNINSWTSLSIEGEVNIADTGTNIALGTQILGPSRWDGIQWTGLKPDRTRNVEINGPYNANYGSIVACNLTVKDVLNFDEGTTNYIMVSNNLFIKNTFTLGDEESLLTLNPSAIIEGEIIKNEKSTPLNNLHDVTYWSSPVENETIGHVFDGVDPNRIFYLNPAAVNPAYAGTIYGHWFIAAGSSIMTTGRGYSAEGTVTGEQLVTFRGKPNNGDLTLTVNYKGSPDDNSENDNFNLVGNPYPSALAIDPLLSDNQNSNLEKTIYLWSHNTPVSGGGDYVGADYATYTAVTGGVAAGSGGAIPNGYLASGQGFMVRTESTGNGLINFENDDRVVDSIPVFFKSEYKKKDSKPEKDRLWISLKSNQGGYKQILLGFIEGAADHKDAFDGLQLKSNNPISIYSIIGNEKFAIQGFGPFSPEKEVVLGFDTDVAPRTFTVGIDQKEGIFKNEEVYLTDNLLGITHNLSQSAYSFEQTISGEFTNRFTLQFAKNSLDVEEIIQGSEFNVFNSAEGFRINASKMVKEVKVYDMMGRMIMSSKPNQQRFNLNAGNLKTGAVLIFEVKLENGTILNKKAIKM